MELYYQGLTSDEASLEQLVDDLEHVIEVANLPPEPRAEITTRLQRLKAACGAPVVYDGNVYVAVTFPGFPETTTPGELFVALVVNVSPVRSLTNPGTVAFIAIL